MLRQNRSEGSSTSRSFAKTALLRARRKTFQFSDEQFARHIFFTEPLFLIPSVQTGVQESGAARGAILFSKEPLFLMPLRPRPVRLEAARKSGSRGDRRTSFEGTTFPRSFPLRSVAPGNASRSDRRESLHSFLEGTTFPPSFRPAGAAGSQEIGRLGPPHFFRGNHFPSFRWVHGRPVGRRPLSSSSFFSSSLQGGSGIPAVPKTGASVLRLLPPTS